MDYRDKQGCFNFLIIFSVMCAIFVFLIIVGIYDQKSKKNTFLKMWNHGYHATDDGKWVMSEAVGHRNGTTYIYKCSKCDSWIELGSPEFYWIKSEEK